MNPKRLADLSTWTIIDSGPMGQTVVQEGRDTIVDGDLNVVGYAPAGSSIAAAMRGEGVTIPSREEVEDLKRRWARDSWDSDLEDTPGFEAYRQELKAYREKLDAEQEVRHQARELREREAIAAKIGVPADHMAVGYVRTLERRLTWIEERLGEVENRFDWGRK